MSPPDPPAVILGGAANAVSVARSLSAAGVTVYAVGDRKSMVRHSRACSGFADLGADGDVQGRWLAWLVEKGPGGVLLPCDDDGLELVARHRRALIELGYVPIEANDDVLAAMLDKERTYTLARRVGIAAPRTITPRDSADLVRVKEKIGFPCALKPRHSHLFRRSGMSGKLIVVSDLAELSRAFAWTRERGLEMLVTEIVPGGDDRYSSYYSYLDQHGRPLLHFTKRKLRQHPVGFGLISYQVTEWDEEVAELGLRFFQGVGVRGLANVEFKRDARDGRLTIIECNHRFTAANELVRIAGIDLALFTYSRLLGRPGPPVDGYREGVRMWHPIDDLRALRCYRRRGELSLFDWLGSLLHRQHLPVFRWTDPKPTFAHHLRKLGGQVPLLSRREVRRGAVSASAT